MMRILPSAENSTKRLRFSQIPEMPPDAEAEGDAAAVWARAKQTTRISSDAIELKRFIKDRVSWEGLFYNLPEKNANRGVAEPDGICLP